MQASAKKKGILSTHLHSDGESAEILAMYNPGTHANYWVEEKQGEKNNEDVFIGLFGFFVAFANEVVGTVHNLMHCWIC